MSIENLNIGVGITGSYCTFQAMIELLKELKEKGANIIPIMSYNAYENDTRFGTANDYISKVEEICNHKVLNSIVEVEPIGPKKLLDILLVLPCTGNTISKIANAISDTPVTCGVKSQLRNQKPVLLAISTNDALSGNAQNIGKLLNTKNIYFVPFGQDDPINKPTSIIYIKDKVIESIESAIQNKQLQPIIC
ncbi:MAG: dipicolinate synthase subunit B [Clostridiales bacterium]|nr:dipicolinate synthase subunit B [Clostridiales bacterium]